MTERSADPAILTTTTGPTRPEAGTATGSVPALRRAGDLLGGALVALVLGSIALAAYFATDQVGHPLGPVSDVLFAAFMLLLAAVAVALRTAVRDATGRWFDALTAAAVASMLITAVGQSALVAGLIDLQTSFIGFTIGLLGVMAWAAGHARLAFGHGLLSRATGMAALAMVGAGVVAPIAWFGLSQTIAYVAVSVLGVAVLAWLVSLRRDLRGGRPAR